MIARDIRALGVYSEIHNYDISAEEIAALPNVKGFILNGGPNGIIDGDVIDASDAVYQAGLPIFSLARYEDDPEDIAELIENDKERQNLLRSFVFDACRAAANWIFPFKGVYF